MTTRRRVTRALLAFGALAQLSLIASLPLGQMNSAEIQSFFSLAALVAISVGCAVSLRRWGRESVLTLAMGCAFATYLMVRGILSIRLREWGNGPSDHPVQLIGVLLALCALAPLPLALIEAWPLGSNETEAGGRQ
jgi:hypothetical protein